jgi:hypothetical protein
MLADPMIGMMGKITLLRTIVVMPAKGMMRKRMKVMRGKGETLAVAG